MNRWFRMYDEMLDNPKVQRLSGDDFKAWVNILCLASRNDGVLPPLDDIAFALRIDAKKAAAMFGRLQSAGLIVSDGDRFTPNKWNERQFKSDVSTERVKRFRKRSKPVSETPPETAPDTEADTEVPLSNDNGQAELGAPNPDKQFWDNAKTYLGRGSGGLINGWLRDHGKQGTAAAISAAQVERAADPRAYIQGYFRKHSAKESTYANGLSVPC